MQRAALLSLCGLALLATSAGASPLAFRAPGEFEADWTGSRDVSWALLVFRDETAAEFSVISPHNAELWNETASYTLQVQYIDGSYTPHKDRENGSRPVSGPFDITAAFPQGRKGSLFIVAERIELSLHETRGILSVGDAQNPLHAFTRFDDFSDDLYRDGLGHELGQSVVVAAGPPSDGGSPFNLVAEGTSHVEWYNAHISCARASPCPTGGGPEVLQLPAPPGFEITSERHTYEAVLGQDFDVQGRGTLDYVIFGSSQMTLGVEGKLRLPLAAGESSCRECVVPSNQTFAAEGNITLEGLTTHQGGLQAEMHGKLESARFDEVPVDPESIFGSRAMAVGAVAVGGGLLALLRLAFPALFTRHKEEGPLTNERRRRLYEHIVKNPGIHFREALRGAEVPAGSGRHHITKLVQAGLIVERRHHNSVCLFPKDDRFTASWHELAALRDPEYRLLHDWLRANPERAQNEIVAAFAASHGWTRSTTQTRVERLAREGLLRFRYQGRYKLYSTARPVLMLANGQEALVGPSPA